MTTNEIAEIIRKYDIYECFGARKGQIVAYAKGITAADRKIIVEVKPEILAYFAERRKKAEEEAKRREETFYSIPGCRELEKARKADDKWRYEFNRAMETEDCVLYPDYPFAADYISNLESQYPDAVFALKVKDEKFSSNYEISSYATKAVEALEAGQPVAEVRKQYDEDKKAFVERHMWD